MPSLHPAHVFPFSGLALDISSSCISLNLNPLGPKAHPKPDFIGSEVHARDGFPTTHIALTVEGTSWSSLNYYPRLVMHSILGNRGGALSSAFSSALLLSIPLLSLKTCERSYSTGTFITLTPRPITDAMQRP